VIAELVAYLRRDGAGLLDGAPEEAPLRILQSNAGASSGSRTKLFVFAGTDSDPRLVCHVARCEDAEKRLRQEWIARQQIRERLPAALRDTVPAALTLAQLGGRFVLIEQGMRGCSMARLVFRNGGLSIGARAKRAFAGAARWLEAFQSATAQETKAWDLDEEEELLSRAFARVGSLLPHESWRELLREARERVRPLRGLEVKRTAQHGDFWAGNVLLRGRTVGVVDWESARLRGVAVLDPILFARAAQHAPHPRVRHLGRCFLDRCLPAEAQDAAVLEGIFFLALLARCQVAPTPGLEREIRALAIAVRRPQTYGWLYA